MKTLLFFCLIMIIFYQANSKQSVTVENSKSFTDGAITFNAEAFTKTISIGAHNKRVFICTSPFSYYEYEGQATSVGGSEPKSATKCRVNPKGELSVIDTSNNLFFLKRVSDVSRYWTKSQEKVLSVTHSIDNKTFILKEDGKIYLLEAENPVNVYKDFSDKTAKDIAVFNLGLNSYGFAIVNKAGEVSLAVTSNTGVESVKKLVPLIYGLNVCVDHKMVLYVNTELGLYRGIQENGYELSKLTQTSFTDIACGVKLWVVGGDGYVYSGVINENEY